MNSNSILKYDLVKDLIYFSKTQTPGLADFIKDYTSSSPETVESLIKDSQIEGITQIPVSASNAIKSFLATVEGLNLATSKNITLNLEILEGIDIGNVDIVSKNFDKSKTYFSKNGTILKDFVLDFKPLSKYKTMANCKPCLKSTWQTDNSFGFTGNVGGSWNGTSWKNGQKLYNITIPKYSLTEPVVNQPYVIWWKPTFSYTFTDFSGIPQIITNKSKWVATLVSDNYSLTTASFFSIVNLFTSNTNPPYIAGGKCPDEKPIPQNFWYNFQGPKGNFRLDSSLQQQLTLYDIQGNVTFKKVCKTYTPSPIVSPPIRWACKATVGCVTATNGPFSTYEECEASCSVDYGWNCFSGSCTPGTQTNPGIYNSLSECSTYCISNYGWICSGSICIPGTVNNTGSYTTEAECIGRCAPYYRCTSTGCVPVPNGTLGAYSTLAACQSSCSVGYNCVNGLCVTSSFGTTGSYATLTACQLSCSVNYGFNCTANGCVPGSAGNPGVYPTIEDCEAKCTASYGFNCVNGSCITGSLASPGIYNTLQECQITCTASYGFTCTPNGCVTGSIASPGIYSSVAACTAACTGSYGWNCTSTGCVPGSPANTGSYLTQQACEAACPSGWNCTGGTIAVLLFSGSIVNGITSSYIPNGTHLFLTESIDTLNIYDNSTGEFEYGETPKFISYTASFTGKTVSSSTGSLHFYFNGAQDPPNNYSQIPILNFPSYTSASITRIISGTTTLNPYGYGDYFTAISLISSSHPSIILNDVQLEFNGTLPHPQAFSCYPVFFPNTGSYLTAIECRSSCSIDYGWNCTINGCVPGTAGNPGEYSTLLDCQTSCNINYGWLCVSGSCVTGSSTSPGTYVNQIDCILNCSNTASFGWNCFSGSCTPGTINNTGSYATLLECQSSCSRQYGWICTSEGCVTGSAGNTGSFSTLSACEDYCFYGWDCVNGNCITSSFGTTGSFPNEIICLLTCSVPYWNCDPIDGCYQVPFGTNTGSFTSFDSCSAACIPTPTSSITGYDCVSGNCVTASVGTGSYATLESCSIYCTQSYGWNCDPTSFYCSPGTINNTGSYTTYESCSAVCAPIPPQSTFCPSCNPTTNIISNGTFSEGSSGWIYNDPIINEYGITNWGFGNNSANIIILPSASSDIYLTQQNVFQISCSYNVCFDITLNSLTGNTIAVINLASIPSFPIDLTPGTTQAISATINNITTQELTLSFITDDSSNQSISIDNVCVTLISCPPPPEPLLDCFISGSGYSFSTGSLDCLCPEGYVPLNGNCIESGSITVSPISIPISSSYGDVFINTGLLGQPNFFPYVKRGVGLQQWNFFGLFSQGIYANITIENKAWDNNRWSLNPALYYDYNLDGSGNSSVNNPSPLEGNPNIYKTQYTFDILKNNLFYTPGPSINPLRLSGVPGDASFGPLTYFPSTYPSTPVPGANKWDTWIYKRLRAICSTYEFGGTCSLVLPPPLWYTNTYQCRDGQVWSGFGTSINNTTPSPKTYYVLIAAEKFWKIKLNGQTIISNKGNYNLDSPLTIENPSYPQPLQNLLLWISFNGTIGANPFADQQKYARIPSDSTAYITTAVGATIFHQSNNLPISAPVYSFNPYINTYISGSWTGTSYGVFESQGWKRGAGSVVLYPVTIPAGQCAKINFEAFGQPVCKGSGQYIGGAIFDNTAEEIANATSVDQLNIVFDSIHLPSLNGINDYTPAHFSGSVWIDDQYPQYIYAYAGFDTNPSSSQYVTQCPPGSTPINGNACNGCLTTTSSVVIPCGDCVTCNHGVLYNGNVVDKGGYQLQGRGPGGIVNTGSVLNTWVIPTELDWNFLSTTLDNNFLPPSSNYEGALNTNSGGKLKDYSRDNNASCWGFPNAGAQTLTNASGWAGVAGGKRDNEGVFSDLGFNGEWWSANSLSTTPITNTTLLATRELKHYSTDVYRNIRSKNYGFSIRLVRPALATETNGQLILDAYQGNDGIYYDGIVIGNRVWITKNLSETLYNNGSLINLEINPNTWSNSPSSNNPSPSNPYSCFYSNDSLNSSKVIGNLNPATGECYPRPSYYVYRSCFSGMYLFQSQIGNTTTPGEVQKDSNENCWEFIEISEGFPNYPPSSIFGSFTTNYFASTPTVYNNCEECNAIHTLYLSFNTKPC
jgi:hypothetical protein